MSTSKNKDIHNFIFARQFHCVPLLLDVFEGSKFVSHFANSLPIAAKQRCQLMLSCLRKDKKVSATDCLDVLSFMNFIKSQSVGAKRKRESSVSIVDKESKDVVFYVRPPVEEPVLFVRLLAQHDLGAEELNYYFARYGFLSCERIASRSSTIETTSDSSPVPSGQEGSEKLFQDFKVTLDSVRNATSAVMELHNPEVYFIAFHSAAEDGNRRNQYSTVDLPSVDQFLYWMFGGVTQLAVFQQLQGSPMGSDMLTPRRQSFNSADSVGASPQGSTHKQLLEYLYAEQRNFEVGREDDEDAGIVPPEIVIDNIPYWTTVDQIREYCTQFGKVEKLRLGVLDRNGAFLGCVAVLMSTFNEALRLSEGLDGQDIEGSTLVAGIMTKKFGIVSLRDGSVKRAPQSILGTPNPMLHERVWL